MQQLGCSMFRYLTETTDEEKLHVRRGTIDLLASHMKMRFVAPGDWVRIKFDLQHMVRQACGDAYLYSRRQAGELLHLIYLRPMRALGDTSLLSVFQQLQLYLNTAPAALWFPRSGSNQQLGWRIERGPGGPNSSD